MSILSIFDIGKTALVANQTAISVTSHNISNVNNPDYSRQQVVLGVKTPIKIRGGYLGRGVSIDNIRRSYDKFLTDMLLNQESNLERSNVIKDIITHVQEFFNESNKEGLNAVFNSFFNSLEDLSVNPSDISKRIVAIDKASSLVSQFRDMEVQLEDILNTINYELKNITDTINGISKDIAELNKKINQLEAGGLSKANDLRDKRDALLRELSKYLNISYHEGEDKTFYVSVGMRNIVAGGNTSDISFLNTSQGARFKIENIDVTDRIIGGKLKGLLASQNLINNEFLFKLRKLFGSFTNQFNLIHQNGYNLKNNTGLNFFKPITDIYYEEFSQNGVITSVNISDYSSLKFDEYYIDIKAGNNYEVINRYNNQVISTGSYISGGTISFDGIDVVISGPVQIGDRFLLSPLKSVIKKVDLNIQDPRDIALSLTPNSYSDNTNLFDLLNLREVNLNSLENKNVYDFLQDLTSKIGVLAKSANDSLTFDETLYNEISNRKNIVQGVNLDEEAVNLIRYQRAFEAAAKVIQVANELYETLVKLV